MTDFSKYYRAYKYMQEILTPDFTHKYLNRCMEDSDKGEDILKGKTNEKVIDMDWVIAFEEALPYIQKAIDEQRRFIKQVENVVRIEKAKKITTDSVKHLAQHTNFIAKVENDMVTPNNILTVEREESFEIYENRMLFTLINNALRFVNDKYKNLKHAPTDTYNEISMKRQLVLNDQRIDFNIEYVNEVHDTRAEDLDVVDLNTLSDFDRVRRIRQTLRDFLSTQLMKALEKCVPVRPPLQQTNLLKKNPNFKKAVELWNFIESYKKKGYEIVGEEYSGAMPQEVQQDMYMAMGFEHFMLSISTNSALRTMLQEKYEEENILLEQEKARPMEELKRAIEAQVYARQQEEIEGYLKDIRDREKKIATLNSEIKNLKMIIDQRDQQIMTLKGQVSMLQDQVEKLEDELKKLKLKLLEAENKIKELEATVEQQKAEIDRLNIEVAEKAKRIEVLEAEKASLLAQVAALTAENEALKARVAECEARIADLESQVASLTEQLEAVKRENAELNAKVAQQAKEIETQAIQIQNYEERTAQLQATLADEVQSHRREVAEQKQNYETQLSEQKTSYETELAGQKASYERQIADNKAEAATEIANAKQICEQQIVTVRKEFEAKQLDAQVAFDNEKKVIEQEHAKALEQQRKEFERKIAAVNKEKDKAYEVEERKFKAQLAKLEKDLNNDYNNKVKAVKAKAEQEKAAAIKKAKEQVKLVKIKARKKLFTKEELENLD